jgi:hypothetical protein
VAGGARSTEKLALARHHLERVRSAWTDPTNWDDLSLYGFYCLEAAVEAAAAEVGMKTSKSTGKRPRQPQSFHRKHGLPEIEQLLRDLNDARKSAAYGDIPSPDLNAEEVASEIERDVGAVSGLVERAEGNGD